MRKRIRIPNKKRKEEINLAEDLAIFTIVELILQWKLKFYLQIKSFPLLCADFCT